MGGPTGISWGMSGKPKQQYLGLSTLQPLVEEDVISAGNVDGKGVLPDCRVRGLVQIG